jgi:xanthine dehydrogenase accessory factor
VVLVTNPFDGYTTANFPKSSKVLQATADQLSEDLIDENSAVVIMSHNHAKDLSYLIAIRNSRPVYLGLLGPVKRRNKLLDEMMEHVGDFPDALMQVIHGPAGLNIGAETAEEIALSICSEIVTIRQNKDAGHLKSIKGGIHCDV